MIAGETITINGDRETSRDFCFVRNAVQANLLAALARPEARGQIYNVAYGARTTLVDLATKIKEALALNAIHCDGTPLFGPFRPGDVRHSLADISKAATLLGYAPTHSLDSGLKEAMALYRAGEGERRHDAVD